MDQLEAITWWKSMPKNVVFESHSIGVFGREQKISLPTPTLMNARTKFCQLSSCFKLNVDDDLRCIYHGIENMAQISKYGGRRTASRHSFR